MLSNDRVEIEEMKTNSAHAEKDNLQDLVGVVPTGQQCGAHNECTIFRAPKRYSVSAGAPASLAHRSNSNRILATST